MVRVYKGTAAKAGRPKLVCNAAKTGVGCRYKSVPLHEVEDALLAHWGALFEDIPAASDEGQLDRAYADQAASIAGTEDHLSDLADAFERAPSAAAGVRLQRVEAELRTMRADLELLDERRAMADRGMVRTRLADLGMLFEAADAGQDPDRVAMNAGLKMMFNAVTVNYITGRVRFHWRQGGIAEIVYAWRDALPA